MKKSLLTSSILAACTLCVQPLFASEVVNETANEAVEKTAQVDEHILVTANRSQQDSYLALSANQIITRDTIERLQVVSVSDILKTVAGIHIANQGDAGQTSSIYTRGTNSNHTLILLDGVRVGSATLGTVNLSAMSAQQIERIEVSADFQKELKLVFDSYILLKNALVEDTASEAQNNAKQLIQNIAQVNMKLLSEASAHNTWMILEKELKNSANAIANTADIKIQREHFISLSNTIINGVTAFGIGQEVYAQFCPMADGNNGASWLSTEKIVNNPYFGASMLKCGSITQTIQ